MSERFERLFALPSNLYSENSPVILSAGALLKDTQTGNIITQLKFQSVSAAPIKALKISINAFDVAGKTIVGVDDYQYLDLKIFNGQSFGSNKAIVMPNAATRSFSVGSITVVLADGTVKNVTVPMTALPKTVPLVSALNNAELVKQYKLEVNQNAAYVPQETDSLWMCSCGTWNTGDSCTQCRAANSTVLSAINISTLTGKANSRLAQEKGQRDEQERLDEIAKKEQAERDRLAEEKRKVSANKAKIAAAICLPIFAAVLVFVLWLYPDVIQPHIAYTKAVELLEAGQYDAAQTAFLAMGDYKDAPEQLTEIEYLKAEDMVARGEYSSAAMLYGQLGDYRDAKTQSFELWSLITNRDSISAGAYHTVGLRSDGTVIAVGDRSFGQCNVEDWTDVIAISASFDHTVGLRSDGTVLAVGSNEEGQCNVEDWEDIVAISAGVKFTIGLKSNGTVVGVGKNFDGECNVENWNNIIAISAGGDHTVALKSDGAVLATGGNDDGQCNITDWTSIVAISSFWGTTIGLRNDGTVLMVGRSDYNRGAVRMWKDMIAVSAGGSNAGVRSDGTVVVVGENDDGECNTDNWENIMVVSAGWYHTVGLKSDGTVVATGENSRGECDVDMWSNIRIPN